MADDIPNRGPGLLGTNLFFAITAFLAVMLRSYVRLFVIDRFALDDWMMLVAMVIFELYCSASIGGVFNGTGRHHVDLNDDQIMRAMRFWWFCYLSYAMAMMASKISIAIFLLRIVVTRTHKWILYTAMAISVTAGMTFFLVTLCQCRPVSFFWDRKQEGGRCLNPDIVVALAIAYSAFAIISDLIFVILPIMLVWNLEMKRRVKIFLVPLLSMGCIASAAVIVRFPYLLKLNSPDFLWDTVGTATWSTVEQGLAITAGSLATIRPLLRRITEKFGSRNAQELNRSPWNDRVIATISTLNKGGHQGGPDDLSSSPLQTTLHCGRNKELPPTPKLRGDHPYCHVSIGSERDAAAPVTPNRIVATTCHTLSVHQRFRLTDHESEEWVGKSKSSMPSL